MTKFYDCFGNRLDAGTSQSKATYSIPFGKLVQGTISNSVVTESSSSDMVIMADTMVMPYKKATIYFTLPNGYTAKVYYGDPKDRTGDTTKVSKNVSATISNGGSFTFPYSETGNAHTMDSFYRIAFIKTGIDVDDVLALIASHDIEVYCDREEEDIIEMNIDQLQTVQSRAWNYDMSENDPVQQKHPIILHVSDLHSDAIRYQRAIKVAEYLEVSAFINTGDNVTQCAKDGFKWPYELIKNTDVLPIVAQGNHDAVFMTEANFVSAFFSDFYDKYDYSQENAYYYKDDESNKIRYIVLNSCDYTSSDGTSYRINTISNTQLEWYANALLDTPEDYKAVVCIHQSPVLVDSVENCTDFMSERTMLSSETISTGGSDVVSITDAFISGSSITVNGSSVDFSEKNEGAEFVMYLNGHTHADHIGYAHGASNIQLCCNIGTGNIMEGEGFTYDYLTHNLGIGKAQDWLNAYVIDGDSGIVTVVRIGSCITTDGKERKLMDIPYKS